jgi:hypothetical protein
MPIARSTLAKFAHLSDTFVETGTHTGQTVETARQLGFKTIYSVELSAKWHTHCVERFKGYEGIHILRGDSAASLKDILKHAAGPCVIWLDAHYSGGDTACGDIPCPIYDELDAIAQDECKEHTILIDDLRGFGEKKAELLFDVPGLEDLSKEGVIERVMAINPNYKISYEDGTHGATIFKDDILVAQL